MTPDALWEGFCAPPDEARPRAWWHWMDGNVDPAGIRLDLEWLHRTGVRGVQVFDGGMGTPLVVPERVQHGSPEWQEAVRLAADLASQLDLEFAVATSAGWSAAGGPWVEPADAMKKVVWSETVGRGWPAGRAAAQPAPGRRRPLPGLSALGCCGRRPPVRTRLGHDRRAGGLRSARLHPTSVTASVPLEDWAPPGRRLLRPLGVAAAEPGRALHSLDRAGLR